MNADEIPFLLEALAAEPENWNTRRYLAEHYLRAGDEPKAVSLVTTAASAPDTEEHALFASQLAASHSFKRGHQLLDAFLVQNASSARAHLLKGKLFALQGIADKSNTHYKVANVLDPHVVAAGDQSLQVEPMQLEGYGEAAPILLPELGGRPRPETGLVPVATVTAETFAQPSVVEVAPEAEVVAEPAAAAPTPMSPPPVAGMAPPVANMAPPETATATPVVAEELQPIEVEPANDPDAPTDLAALPADTADVAPPPVAGPTLERSADQIAMESTAMVAMAPSEAAEEAVQVVQSIEAEGDEAPDDMVAQIVERQTAMVAAMSDTSDEVVKKPVIDDLKDTNNKVSSILIAVLAHVGIILLFGLVAMAIPETKPPEIYAAVASADVDSELEKTNIEKPTVQQQAPQAQQVEVLTSSMFSDIAMPTVDVSTISDMVGMSAETGMDFGMSFGMPGGGSGMSHIPPSMAGRCSMGQRMQRLKESGATAAAESAVRKALQFMKRNQNEDGSFGKEYPAAVTALVVLAMLGHCETPDSVEFGNTVTRATQYLMERAKKSDHKLKAIMSPGGKAGYENAICTYALCEMFTMTNASGSAARIPRLESAMKQGVKAIIEGQITRGAEEGGWDYGYRAGTGDGSVTGWQFQALKAASNTGERISGLDKAMEKAIKWFKFAQTPQGGTAYRPGREKTERHGLAGVGTLAFLMYGDDGKEFEKSIENLEKNYIKGNPHGYTWYYVMQAFFLHGGDSWKKWNEFAMPKILAAQADDGRFKINAGHGPKDPVSKAVYETCLSTLMLEVYYRYLPTSQKNFGN